MYKCDICGRQLFKKIMCHGYILCAKHLQQYYKYGKFIDANPRTTNDPNHYRVEDDVAIVDLYNQKSVKIAEFIIDKEDINKIKHYHWRLSHGRVVTGNHTNTRPTKYLTHIILNINDTDYNNKIDHIDGDPLNNRKVNLRVCTQGENTLNKARVSNNTSGFIGVHPDRRKNRKSQWCAEIRRNNRQYHLGAYVHIEEAVYARYIAEIHLFGEYRNKNYDEDKMQLFSTIDNNRKREIETYIQNKLSA